MTMGVFTAIAPIYDRMNGLLSLGLDKLWRRRLVNDMRGAVRRVVDLAAGTGELTREIARRFPDAEIAAFDVDEAMLTVARGKNNGPGVTFHRADASYFSSCVEGRVDVVTCAFGFRNFLNIERALQECRKVLSPDGELALLEFFRVPNGALSWCIRLWIMALTIWQSPMQRAAYRYLCDSMRQTYGEQEFVALAARCGFRLIRRRRYFPCCIHLVFVAV